ncbi:MAG TPA: TetR/AcrR family transcriptional regulator [Oculatellaceae cyanobacterium]
MQAKSAHTRTGPVPPQKRREDILGVASRIFAEHGYRNTDVQVIADELGIGKGTIYRTFATKEDLFLACVDDGMSRLDQWLVQEMTCLDSVPNLSQFERLERKIYTFLSFFEHNPSLIELMVQERSEFKDRATTSYLRHWEKNFPRWIKNVEEAQELGRIRKIPAMDYLQVMCDVLYGAIFTSYFSKKRIDLSYTAKVVADVLLYGLKGDVEY